MQLPRIKLSNHLFYQFVFGFYCYTHARCLVEQIDFHVQNISAYGQIFRCKSKLFGKRRIANQVTWRYKHSNKNICFYKTPNLTSTLGFKDLVVGGTHDPILP